MEKKQGKFYKRRSTHGSSLLEQYENFLKIPSLVSLEELKAPGCRESLKRRAKKISNEEQLRTLKRRTDQIGSSRSSGGSCLHPESFSGVCTICCDIAAGSVVPIIECISKHSSLATSEKIGLWDLHSDPSMKTKRMTLVLDLDHTLLNSTHLTDLSTAEVHLFNHVSTKKGLLHRLDFVECSMLTKLRPFVPQFLKEADNMFDLYIYTMGTQDYATEIVKLLDPENKYFPSKVLSRSDSTQKGKKGLDVVFGSKACSTIILDDKRSVWMEEDKENVIEMGRYSFFASSCRGTNSTCIPLSQQRNDEREADGTLASILHVLKRAYQQFLVMDSQITAAQPDVRRILQEIRSEVLRGCVVAFTGAPPSLGLGWRPLWQVAEELGAKCCMDLDASVTHIIATDFSTDVVPWALRNDKFLLHTNWLETAGYLWRRPKEVEFLLLSTEWHH